MQPLFITVDPEKDTPAQLKGYVALFHPRLVGLTGDARQIRRVARAYKVYYAKTAPTKRDSYDIDHTGFVFLIGPDGKYIGYLPPGTPAEPHDRGHAAVSARALRRANRARPARFGGNVPIFPSAKPVASRRPAGNLGGNRQNGERTVTEECPCSA